MELALTLETMRLIQPKASFNPVTALSAKHWYEPRPATLFQTDGTTPAVADGGTGKITDEGSAAKHLLQATAGFQPLYKTGGGLHWLEFDGTDDRMTVSVASATAQPYTVVAAVLFENAAGSNGNVYADGSTASRMGSQNANNYRIFAGTANVAGGTRNAAAHVMFGFFNGASSTLKIDGVQVATGDPGSGASGATTIFMGSTATPDQFLDGRLYILGVIPRALTAGEEASLLAYMNARAGI
jgi:hypothetical protein